MSARGKAALVPEICCYDVATSLELYTNVLGFRVLYERVEKGFYYLERQGVEIMLEQLHDGSWLAAPAEKPLGRGISFQIKTTDLAALYHRCKTMDAPIFQEWEETSYRAGSEHLRQAEFLVQDPDGYLLRFAQTLGARKQEPLEQDAKLD